MAGKHNIHRALQSHVEARLEGEQVMLKEGEMPVSCRQSKKCGKTNKHGCQC